MNYSQIMSGSHVASKSGSHVPQLLWERHPCLAGYKTSLFYADLNHTEVTYFSWWKFEIFTYAKAKGS